MITTFYLYLKQNTVNHQWYSFPKFTHHWSNKKYWKVLANHAERSWNIKLINWTYWFLVNYFNVRLLWDSVKQTLSESIPIHEASPELTVKYHGPFSAIALLWVWLSALFELLLLSARAASKTFAIPYVAPVPRAKMFMSKDAEICFWKIYKSF